MLLPGPEAQQVATYIGWRLHGTLGGIVAGSFFVIPSIFVLWLLSYLAVAHSDVPAITGLLYGIQPVVIAIVEIGEHTSELQSRQYLVCRLLLEKKKNNIYYYTFNTNFCI